jgi:hypothetical protein
MHLLPSAVIVGLLLVMTVHGGRAIAGDLRRRRWLWALAGTLATLAGIAALALLVLYTGLLRD